MTKWKDILGWEGIYQVSNTGKIKSLPRKINTGNGGFRISTSKILKGKITIHGYIIYGLSFKGKHTMYFGHRLVAEAFILNPENKPFVNHKDGNKLNNNNWNLEWVTQSENEKHAFKIGLKKGRKGVSHHNSKLSESDITIIKSSTLTYDKIAEVFQISIAQISRIKNNKQWTHL